MRTRFGLRAHRPLVVEAVAAKEESLVADLPGHDGASDGQAARRIKGGGILGLTERSPVPTAGDQLASVVAARGEEGNGDRGTEAGVEQRYGSLRPSALPSGVSGRPSGSSRHLGRGFLPPVARHILRAPYPTPKRR